MKGRKLTLEEVLNLEDGSKVWVEELNEDDKELSSLHVVDGRMLVNHRRKEAYDYTDLKFYKNELEFYEWIEESEMPYPNKMQQTIKDMAQEICNLRGLDLTDYNIRLIIKEFS